MPLARCAPAADAGAASPRPSPRVTGSGSEWKREYRQTWEREQLKRMAKGYAGRGGPAPGTDASPAGEGGGGSSDGADQESAARAALLAAASVVRVVQALSPGFGAGTGPEPRSGGGGGVTQREGNGVFGGVDALEGRPRSGGEQVSAETGMSRRGMAGHGETPDGGAAAMPKGRSAEDLPRGGVAPGAAVEGGQLDSAQPPIRAVEQSSAGGEGALASDLTAEWGWEVAPGERESAILHRLVRCLEEEEDVNRALPPERGCAAHAGAAVAGPLTQRVHGAQASAPACRATRTGRSTRTSGRCSSCWWTRAS